MNRSPALCAPTARALPPLLAFLLLVSGCSSTSSRYFFAAADLNAEKPKLTFYRVTVKGNARNVKASYAAGFYDAAALHHLFGVVEKPTDGKKITEDSGKFDLELDPVTGRWQVLNDGQRFTIVYGADAKAVSDQVKLFASSDAAGKQMAGLLAAAVGGPAFADAEAAKRRAADTKKFATDLAGDLKSLQAKVQALDPATVTPEDLRKHLLEAVQRAAAAAGSSTQFDANLDTAFKQAETLHKTLRDQGRAQ